MWGRGQHTCKMAAYREGVWGQLGQVCLVCIFLSYSYYKLSNLWSKKPSPAESNRSLLFLPKLRSCMCQGHTFRGSISCWYYVYRYYKSQWNSTLASPAMWKPTHWRYKSHWNCTLLNHVDTSPKRSPDPTFSYLWKDVDAHYNMVYMLLCGTHITAFWKTPLLTSPILASLIPSYLFVYTCLLWFVTQALVLAVVKKGSLSSSNLLPLFTSLCTSTAMSFSETL